MDLGIKLASSASIDTAVGEILAQWGRIVNISTGVTVDGVPGAGWYATVKTGLHGLTRYVYTEPSL